jgi:predicted DNA-binding transcriptional regulator YafY
MAVEHVRHAIERGVDLEIDYKGGKGQSRRRVQPRAIRGMSVRAFCYTRGEELDFRLDRILDAVEIAADEAPDRADPVVDPGCSETGSPAPTG